MDEHGAAVEDEVGRCCGGPRVPARVGTRVLTCRLLGLVVEGPLWDGTVDERPGPRRSCVGRTRASLLSCVWIEVVGDVTGCPSHLSAMDAVPVDMSDPAVQEFLS